MTSFEFATATRIVFGAGVLSRAGELARELGSRALVVGGSSRERLEPLLEVLAAQGIGAETLAIAGEPTLAMLRAGLEQARASDCDLVIGMGGGSAIDAGKALAALLRNPGDVLDYLEVVGKGQALSQPPLPYIAIPTTAGTGAEVTRNAVIGVPERQVKVSMRSPLMLPRLALIDPRLTYGLPPAVTASTGLDALTQCLEPFVSAKANPLSDALCREGMRRAARSLRRAFHAGDDATAREDMAVASLCGGLALANAGLGVVHGFAGPLGGMVPAAHGMLCARLLPFGVEANLHALREREPDSPALARYREIAQLLSGDSSAQAEDAVDWLHALCAELEVPPLHSFGLHEKDVSAAVERAQQSSSMRGNPLVLNSDELTRMLRQAL